MDRGHNPHLLRAIGRAWAWRRMERGWFRAGNPARSAFTTSALPPPCRGRSNPPGRSTDARTPIGAARLRSVLLYHSDLRLLRVRSLFRSGSDGNGVRSFGGIETQVIGKARTIQSEPNPARFARPETKGRSETEYGAATSRRFASIRHTPLKTRQIPPVTDGLNRFATGIVAVREGFEPPIESPLYTRSKRAPSTARPPHPAKIPKPSASSSRLIADCQGRPAGYRRSGPLDSSRHCDRQ